MGTNYYLHDKPPCPTCGREYERLHIGKSSGGWCFSLHVIPEEGIFDLSGWIERWNKPEAVILNEYGDVVAPSGMHAVITERAKRIGWHDLRDEVPSGYKSWAEFHERNSSCEGPNGLLRHRIDRRHCIAHGAGTWDLIVGEFS